MSNPTVSLLCPIGEAVSPLTFQSALTMVGYASKNGVDIQFIGVTERTLIEKARNTLAQTFLKTESEWSFWMDADMVFPKETIVQLLKTAKAKDAKMVTGIYYQRGGKNFPVCWIRDPKLESKKAVKYINNQEYDANEYLGTFAVPGPEATEPFEVNSAGFGCALIHRNVFEATENPWFLFLPHKCSEDFYFFVNAQKKGYKLWADPIPRLGHIGEPKVVYKEDCYASMKEHEINLEPVIKS